MSDYLEDRVKTLEDEVEILKKFIRLLAKEVKLTPLDHEEFCAKHNAANREYYENYYKKLKKPEHWYPPFECHCGASKLNDLIRD